jgi:ribosomal protein S18 acetylase RimI-like enzyme
MVMQDLELKILAKTDTELVKAFVENAGNSTETFRYFNKRPFEIIQQHVVTIVALYNNQPIAYGHLDKDGDTIWLGIAIAEAFRGKGLGKVVMQELVNQADARQIATVALSVDKANVNAIHLYQKFQFEHQGELNETVLLMKRKLGNG